jgi:predicted nucleotidyltransferase
MEEAENSKILIKAKFLKYCKMQELQPVLFFWSRAREDYTKFSDYDILLITDRTIEIKEKMNLSKKIREYLAKAGFDVDEPQAKSLKFLCF